VNIEQTCYSRGANSTNEKVLLSTRYGYIHIHGLEEVGSGWPFLQNSMSSSMPSS
jgi:hypothetical protein